jgi:hypothetical protein
MPMAPVPLCLRIGPAATIEAFRAALAAAGVNADTPATVLCDGDAVVLDWWHAAVRLEHALQAVSGLGRSTAHAHLVDAAVRPQGR